MITNKTISFIGTGKMATALIGSIISSKMEVSLISSDKNENNLNYVKNKFKIKTTKDNKEAVKNSDVIFLCVKPQNFPELLNEIKDEVKNQLIVSIAAGIKTSKIESALKNARVIRVMPNINCLVGEAASGFCRGKYATKKDMEFVKAILDSSGISFEIKEKQIDVLSTISGCGPAFFAYFIKHMANAASKKGIPREMAEKLAIQTLLGTGKLMLEKNITPDKLITMVASKKGVTLAGLNILEKNKTGKILEKMINAAYKRSIELGK